MFGKSCGARLGSLTLTASRASRAPSFSSTEVPVDSSSSTPALGLPPWSPRRARSQPVACRPARGSPRPLRAVRCRQLRHTPRHSQQRGKGLPSCGRGQNAKRNLRQRVWKRGGRGCGVLRSAAMLSSKPLRLATVVEYCGCAKRPNAPPLVLPVPSLTLKTLAFTWKSRIHVVATQ